MSSDETVKNETDFLDPIEGEKTDIEKPLDSLPDTVFETLSNPIDSMVPYSGSVEDYYRIQGDIPYLWLQDNVGTTGRWNIQNRDGRLDIYRGTGGTNLTLVHNGGKVGIGVTNPSNKLDVAGTIRAEEIIVETGWADFVFKDNYELMPLDELETYIQKEGHLPDIVTENDVQKSGLSLGSNQTRLLQKIEELTLYIIAQNRRISELEKRINRSMNSL